MAQITTGSAPNVKVSFRKARTRAAKPNLVQQKTSVSVFDDRGWNESHTSETPLAQSQSQRDTRLAGMQTFPPGVTLGMRLRAVLRPLPEPEGGADPHWAENAEQEYTELLQKRHEEGHL